MWRRVQRQVRASLPRSVPRAFGSSQVFGKLAELDRLNRVPVWVLGVDDRAGGCVVIGGNGVAGGFKGGLQGPDVLRLKTKDPVLASGRTAVVEGRVEA